MTKLHRSVWRALCISASWHSRLSRQIATELEQHANGHVSVFVRYL